MMTAPAPFAELPAAPAWDYGGLSYGLEPLTLPTAGLPLPQHSAGQLGRAAPQVPRAWPSAISRRIRAINSDGVAKEHLARSEDPAELFGFRWITGHQVSFVLWVLMAQALDDHAGGRIAPEELAETLPLYVRGYCAMLLYSGSCPTSVYEDVIRPSMRRQHPGFSGSWAPDFRPVRQVFRGRDGLPEVLPDGRPLADALELHRHVHESVAARLVPGGVSLLRQSPTRHRNTRLLNLIYDNYFFTLRAPVSWPEVLTQLSRRLVAIAQDLTVNGIDGGFPHEEAPGPWQDAVAGCRARLEETLAQIAIHAPAQIQARLQAAPAEWTA
ncbi:hypothetical protein [Amycolatopsis alba]|nr:hypothetical protein [Amycolatopsis alba]